MADQAITALPKKTYSGSSQIASTDYLLGIDSAEGYQMLIQDLGEYIINRATASLAGSTQTLASAINALNSNKQNFSGVINDTRLPSSNQQIENVSIGQSRNIMYVGNNDTINELIFQSADTGSFSLSNLYKALGVKMKETTASGGEITFTFTGNRYNAILMIQSNSFSSSGIYGLIFKKDSGSSIKSLVGNESLPTIDNNGSITFNMVSWSRAVLYTTAGDEFS